MVGTAITALVALWFIHTFFKGLTRGHSLPEREDINNRIRKLRW